MGVEDGSDLIRRIVTIASCVVAIVAGTAWLWQFTTVLPPDVRQRIATDHFAVVMGMPICALTALLVVIVFRSASGPVEFEALGFKFKGAAGETAMWIATFLALIVALKLLY